MADLSTTSQGNIVDRSKSVTRLASLIGGSGAPRWVKVPLLVTDTWKRKILENLTPRLVNESTTFPEAPHPPWYGCQSQLQVAPPGAHSTDANATVQKVLRVDDSVPLLRSIFDGHPTSLNSGTSAAPKTIARSMAWTNGALMCDALLLRSRRSHLDSFV